MRVLESRLLLLLSIGIGAAAPAQTIGIAPADKLLADGHYRRAEVAIRAALARTPNDAHYLSDLSIVDWAFNRLDSAIANGEKAVAADPRSAEAHAHLGDALGAKLASSNAGTFEKIALVHRFRKEVDKTLEFDPNDVDALQDLAQFYWNAPGMVGGDKNKARQTADRLFPISPFRAATARADFLNDDTNLPRRNAAVITVWRTAVAARPDDYEARAALAAACLEDPARFGDAETEANRAVAIDPTRVNAWSTLATLYAKIGRWAELDATLKQARAKVSDDRTPQYRAAVAILTSNATAQLSLAETWLRDYLTQPPEGQAPSHAGAHWRLGLVLEKQGRKADAIRELQTAVQMDGSLDAAKRDLKRLT
ncbi:tetratricopeptide (TPR) repeat protein [Granulicella aggregans]|uniref:Tetratricopeptide (TPR) repeat protein n=1 Tax=Granulicella aggregans TaxID=474949 RepID=A0A7W7ZEM8_9BACT|nr:tetratricopeptide repeat protein [Granulicella aggregans]MBB5058387.1 tetratricopeptide (TPR) repeat protein [Granulicella aggregans]